MVQGWRLEFDWTGLSHQQKRRLLTIVGDCGGEWWGRGRAEFGGRDDATRCAVQATSQSGVRSHLYYWVA
jgi:hypothetical protein